MFILLICCHFCVPTYCLFELSRIRELKTFMPFLHCTYTMVLGMMNPICVFSIPIPHRSNPGEKSTMSLPHLGFQITALTSKLLIGLLIKRCFMVEVNGRVIKNEGCNDLWLHRRWSWCSECYKESISCWPYICSQGDLAFLLIFPFKLTIPTKEQLTSSSVQVGW